MTTEKLLEYATMAGTYFRALTNDGVPPQHAVSLTSAFIGNIVFADAYGKKPIEPWEDKGDKA